MFIGEYTKKDTNIFVYRFGGYPEVSFNDKISWHKVSLDGDSRLEEKVHGQRNRLISMDSKQNGNGYIGGNEGSLDGRYFDIEEQSNQLKSMYWGWN